VPGKTPIEAHVATVTVKKRWGDKKGNVGRGHAGVHEVLVVRKARHHHGAEGGDKAVHGVETRDDDMHTTCASQVGIVREHREEILPDLGEKIRIPLQLVVEVDHATPQVAHHGDRRQRTYARPRVPVDVYIMF